MSDLEEVEKRLGFVAKERVRRVIVGWAALLVLDIITFLVALAVVNKQQDTIDALHVGICRNSGVLVDGLRKDLAQTQNRNIYKEFFPQIPQDRLDQVIAKQVADITDQIAKLSVGCPAVLAVPLQNPEQK